MHGENSYPVPYRRHYSTAGTCSRIDLLRYMENNGVMRNYEVAVPLNSFQNNRFCGIQADQNAKAGIAPFTQDQSAIVVIFLKVQRRQRFQKKGNFRYVHSPENWVSLFFSAGSWFY